MPTLVVSTATQHPHQLSLGFPLTTPITRTAHSIALSKDVGPELCFSTEKLIDMAVHLLWQPLGHFPPTDTEIPIWNDYVEFVEDWLQHPL